MSSFEERVRVRTAPWEIGKAQPAVASLIERGGFKGRVLEVGCGTGENAMAIALAGGAHLREVVGIDRSAAAIDEASEKCRARQNTAKFVVGDALDLAATVTGTFDTVLDSGFFHALSDQARVRYVRSLERILRFGANLHVLCFSDEEPDWGGPRRIGREELFSAFPVPFRIEGIGRTQFAHRLREEGSSAWIARICFVGRPLSFGN